MALKNFRRVSVHYITISNNILFLSKILAVNMTHVRHLKLSSFSWHHLNICTVGVFFGGGLFVFKRSTKKKLNALTQSLNFISSF